MPARLRASWLLVGVLLVSVSAAWSCSKSPPPQEPKLCFLERPSELGGASRPVRPADWLRLIVRLRPKKGSLYAEHDCTGVQILWHPPPASCLIQSPLLEDPVPQPLDERSVFERQLPSEQRLVWVVTHRFANGEGFGPVALARILPNGIEVEAIGQMRLRTERVNLELWKIEGNSVVVAGGEICTKPNDSASCHRAVSVLVAYNKALLHPVLSYRDGRCIDEPWVELKRQEDLPLKTGWNRHFEIISMVSHDQRYVVITEQVVVADSDPNAPDLPPREVRRIDTDRFIHVERGRLVTRQHPLWPRILPSVGSTALGAKMEP